MQVKVSARHGHLSEANQAKIREKAEHLTHYYDRITMIQAIVDLEQQATVGVELLVSVEPSHEFVATERAGELTKALDAVMHKMEQQLRKYKEKLQDSRG
ncbi:MAG: ribosome-associated translation inhibitor RaiA [Pirellulales bacterium]|nr:ribosome-associated translation inhibitor RaiA [Pirellulales bacterium]